MLVAESLFGVEITGVAWNAVAALFVARAVIALQARRACVIDRSIDCID